MERYSSSLPTGISNKKPPADNASTEGKPHRTVLERVSGEMPPPFDSGLGNNSVAPIASTIFLGNSWDKPTDLIGHPPMAFAPPRIVDGRDILSLIFRCASDTEKRNGLIVVRIVAPELAPRCATAGAYVIFRVLRIDVSHVPSISIFRPKEKIYHNLAKKSIDDIQIS